MNTYIALFRGINVGGNNILPMRELVEVLSGLEVSDVKTYIQSGNVAFRTENDDASQLAQKLSTAVEASHGFAPRVMVLTQQAMTDAIKTNPFPKAEAEPKSLHLYFLEAEPEGADLALLEGIQKENERFSLKSRVFYLHAPDGVWNSKVAARAEKVLGVAATARNWRTVCKIAEIAAVLETKP